MPKCHICQYDHNSFFGALNYFTCSRCSKASCNSHGVRHHIIKNKQNKVCNSCYFEYPKQIEQFNKFKRIVDKNDITLVMHDHDLEYSPGNSLVYDYLSFCKEYDLILCMEGGYINYDYQECVNFFARKYSNLNLCSDIMFLIQGFLVLPIGLKQLKRHATFYEKDFHKFNNEIKIYSFDTPRTNPHVSDSHLECFNKSKYLMFPTETENFWNVTRSNGGYNDDEKIFLSKKYSDTYKNLLTKQEQRKISDHVPITPQLKKLNSEHNLSLVSQPPKNYKSDLLDHSRYCANTQIASRLIMLWKIYNSLNYRKIKRTKIIILCGTAHEITPDNSSKQLPKHLMNLRVPISAVLRRNSIKAGVVNCICYDTGKKLKNNYQHSAQLLHHQGVKFFEYPDK
ncbi:MAG: hypothetical protein GY750_04730 [Lentisphaerae bacterium]|nr:hypothetical protein [Lentisphaerota bacterium]MCP4100717.1 hypothetical protein [Lentisphaerota bacterium]